MVASRGLLFSQPVVKMVSLGRAVFWWETARFVSSNNSDIFQAIANSVIDACQCRLRGECLKE